MKCHFTEYEGIRDEACRLSLRSSIKEHELPIIGFCFSFPVEQTAVDAGKLLRWTKGYTNPGAVGMDPAKLLTDAFKRRVSSTSPSVLLSSHLFTKTYALKAD